MWYCMNGKCIIADGISQESKIPVNIYQHGFLIAFCYNIILLSSIVVIGKYCGIVSMMVTY